MRRLEFTAVTVLVNRGDEAGDLLQETYAELIICLVLSS